MALFGEKCARCGHRTRQHQDDEPICESCSGEMQLVLQAEGEQRRRCPVDGHEMVKEVAHMLIIDRCPKCHGVWLDAGELERIKGGVEAEALVAMSSGLSMPFR
ncbi:MAG: zf-TFIIB domain-containing protein [Pseudomonadota bacterium]